MRAIALVSLTVVVVLIGVPAIVVGSWGDQNAGVNQPAYNPTIKLYVQSSRQIMEIGLEDYVKGVLAAEMPAAFELEALQAQAVAARTYVVKRAGLFGGDGCDAHPGADVCDDPAHCQAWLATAALQQKWGMIDYHTYWDKITQAVMETSGEIVTYQGVAIDPVFHSTCGGQTEDAANVWQRSLPYLKSTTCPYCLESPKFLTDQRFALTAFLTAVRSADDAVAVTAQQIKGGVAPLTIKSETSTGRVNTVVVGGRTISATELRSVLGLNSTNFTYELDEDAIVFHVQGYGHGVGLCQYGANGMAKAGKTYRQILSHYYQGTALSQLR